MIQLLTSEIPDPTGWLVSVKMDGVRILWTGTALLFRSGRRCNAPAWFTKNLPNHRLDGELWMGNGTFDSLVSTIQKKDGDWGGVGFYVFDLAEDGSIEQRIERLEKIKLPNHAHRVNHRICTGMADLDAMESAVVAAGGEGCVIRRPGSKYRPGRKGDTIKVKRISQDIDRWQG